MSQSILVLYPIYDLAQGHNALVSTVRNIVAHNQTSDDKVSVLGISHLDDAAQEVGALLSDDAPISFLNKRAEGFAGLLNAGLAHAPQSIQVLLPEGIELFSSFFAGVAKAANENPQAGAFFGNYIMMDKGDEKAITLTPNPRPLTERHDFGFVTAYNGAFISEKVGEARKDMVFAADYDIQLRIVSEGGVFQHIDDTIYRATPVEAAEEETSNEGAQEAEVSGQLHAPGKGKFGGFSYLFYPTRMDNELNNAFTSFLKRMGAYLEHAEHPHLPVPYPEAEYPMKASVVIPVLNRVKYIGHAIKNVQTGTFQDFEIIVVDNGSTDGSTDVVKKMAEEDPRIRLFEQNGKTIASALNRGIREARGKYICQLDSDDQYTPTTLERVVEHFENNPTTGLAISYYGLMDSDAKPLPELGLIKHLGYGRNVILRRDGGGALRVFPKCVLEQFGLYDEENFGNFGEDYDMVLKTGEKYSVDRIHAELYRYRRHEDNTDITRSSLMKVQNKNGARWNAVRRRQEQNGTTPRDWQP